MFFERSLTSGSSLVSEHAFVENGAKVPAITALCYPGDQRFQARGVDPTQTIGNLLWARNLEPLALLDGFNENRCFDERIVGPRIEPCEASPQHLGAQLASLQIPAIHIRDFQLPARRRSYLV